MKKTFEIPEIQISMFKGLNILTASGVGVEAKDNFSYSKSETTYHTTWDSMTDTTQQ